MAFVKSLLYLSFLICWLGVETLAVNASSRTQKSQPLSPYHIARLREVTEVAISPDGKRIAYVLRVPRKLPQEKNGPPWQQLHVVTPDGESRPYVRGRVRISDISWTSDGLGISFLAKRKSDKNKSLYLISIDGGEARRLLSHETDIKEYSWSPFGRQVAFLATEKLSNKQKKLRDWGFNQEIFREDWQPVKVWVTDIEKDREQKTKAKVLEIPGSASELHWAPRGSKLAVALAPTSLVDDSYTSRKVRVVDTRSGRVIGRINNAGKLDQIIWSPDATKLALIGSVDERDPEAGRLQVSRADGGALQEMLPNYLGHVRKLAWFEPGNIFYLADEGVGTILGRIAINDGAATPALDPGQLILRDFSVSKDGRSIAFICSSPTHPKEVCYWSENEQQLVRLSNNNPWLDRIALGSQEVLKYKARDGLELEGILIRPVGYEEGKRYPLILVVHGGPESHYRHEWLTFYHQPGQMAATQGYLVFYPNYRGSTGRGVIFSQLGQGDPAGKEFDDLADAIDFLVQIGWADPDKVGITGKSYGGYAAAWGATYYSHKFAAAVASFGISNNISKVGTTDIPEEEYLVHALRRPWSDWQFFLKRSPIYHAGNSRTPTLLLHGDSDPRLPLGQSMELYTHLKKRSQAPVRLVIYPNEKHGNARAASRLDYSLRMMRWFNYYLKGSGGQLPPLEIEELDLHSQMKLSSISKNL
ncbi:MAG: prolyl oligopeptidase family serine peptidase [Prochloraceae cyanobacterium]